MDFEVDFSIVTDFDLNLGCGINPECEGCGVGLEVECPSVCVEADGPGFGFEVNGPGFGFDIVVVVGFKGGTVLAAGWDACFFATDCKKAASPA